MSLQGVAREIAKHYECKIQVLGFDPSDEEQVNAFNRVISWSSVKGVDVVPYNVDLRHVEAFASGMRLRDVMPLASLVVKIAAEKEEIMSDDVSTVPCKSLVAGANYLASNGPDIRYVCKGLGHATSAPTAEDSETLKGFGRYLAGRSRLVRQHWGEKGNGVLVARAGANCVGSRKASKSQPLVAISPGEFESYAVVKTIVESIGVRSVAEDL